MGNNPSSLDVTRVLVDDLLDRERLWWLVSGLAPCALVLTTLAGVLWGSDASLRDVALPGEERAADGIAWLSLVALCMLIAFGVLQLLVRPLVWHRFRYVSKEVNRRLDAKYGLATAVVWPRLVQVMPPVGAEGLRRDGRRFATRAGWSIGYVLTGSLAGLVLGLASPKHWFLLGVIATVAFLLAGQAFRESRIAALVYGESVVSAVDLHRFALLRSLHLPLPESPEKEKKETWRWTHGDTVRIDAEYVYPVQALSPEAARAVVDAIFVEPPLIEYQGWVGGWVEAPSGEVLPYSDERFIASGDSEHFLAVAIKRDPFEKTPCQPIDTGEGVSAADVPFRVSVDSGDIALPPVPQDLVVPLDDISQPLRIAFRTPAAGEHRIFIYVLQRSRLLQVVEVRVAIARGESVA